VVGVRGATAGVPNKRQAFVELAVGFVDEQVRAYSRRSPFHRAAGFDGVRVGAADEFHGLPAGRLGRARHTPPLEHGFRIVPTADVNTTFALALSVWG